MTMKVSKIYGMDIYTDAGKFLGKALFEPKLYLLEMEALGKPHYGVHGLERDLKLSI